MKTSKLMSASWLPVLLVAASFSLHAQEKTLSEKAKIEALLKHIEGLKDATFIRNNKKYDAPTAAKFLRAKWEAQAKAIQTAADFIDKVASISSTTQQPYRIRFKAGREVKSGEYLKMELKKLEKAQ